MYFGPLRWVGVFNIIARSDTPLLWWQHKKGDELKIKEQMLQIFYEERKGLFAQERHILSREGKNGTAEKTVKFYGRRYCRSFGKTGIVIIM